MTNRTTFRMLAACAVSGAILAACDRKEPEPTATAPVETPAASAPAARAPSGPPTAGGTIDASALVFSVPSGWMSKPPGTMRLAELVAPAPADTGAEPAEVAVFSFGPQGAGDAASNVARWASLVHDDSGNPAPHTETTETIGGLTITLVESRGTYQSGSPAGPKTPKPGSALFGAIIEGGPEGPLYIRMTGPAAVMDAQRDRWLEMIRSVRPAAH